MEESAENRVFRKLVEQQSEASVAAFCPMRWEKQMEHLFAHLSRDFGTPGRKVLDICGGYGRLTHFMHQLDSRQNYYCLDSSERLIARAKQAFSAQPNIHCEVADLYTLFPKYDKAFDLSIIYKTLYCLPYYEKAIEQLVRVTRDRIYVTSPFFDGDIEFVSRIYPNASAGDATNYHYSNSYSIPKFRKYCESLGVRTVEFEDMRLDFDLPRPASKDVLGTHTVRTKHEGRLEVTGALLLDWKLAILTL